MHQRRSSRVLPRQDAIRAFNDRDRGTEASERLAEFATDASAAEDGEPRRQFLQIPERV